MSSNWFPFHYRDVKGWHASGLPLTGAVDESAKLLDSAMTQLILNDVDPHDGGVEKTMTKLLQQDPNFIMGRVISYCYEIFGASPRRVPELVDKIKQFVSDCKNLEMSQWERNHVKALSFLAKEDWLTSATIYEDILLDHPKDMHALQLLFGIFLYTGMSERLRDVHLYAANKHTMDDRFYGNIHGKICFGYEECGQFAAAEHFGDLALQHTPNDIWSLHSVVHVKEETFRPFEGLKFMEEKSSNWEPRASLTQHMWWHKALFHIGAQDFESAVCIFDEKLLSGARKDNNSFHLSDATSLLMRLGLEGESLKISLKDRWREVAALYEDHVESSDANLFYDFHTFIACLYGDQSSWATRTKNLVLSSYEDEERAGWNTLINRELAAPLLGGLESFYQQDYEKTVHLMRPVRYSLAQKIGGSHAQKDILSQILFWASAKSKNIAFCEQLLQERVARVPFAKPEGQNGLHQRMQQAIALL